MNKKEKIKVLEDFNCGFSIKITSKEIIHF